MRSLDTTPYVFLLDKVDKVDKVTENKGLQGTTSHGSI